MEQFDIMGDTFIRFPAKCKTKRSIALLNVRVESIFSTLGKKANWIFPKIPNYSFKIGPDTELL